MYLQQPFMAVSFMCISEINVNKYEKKENYLVSSCYVR